MSTGLAASQDAISRTSAIVARQLPSVTSRRGRFSRLAAGIGFGVLVAAGATAASAEPVITLASVDPNAVTPIVVPAKASASASSSNNEIATGWFQPESIWKQTPALNPVALDLDLSLPAGLRSAAAPAADALTGDPEEILTFGQMRVKRRIVEAVLRAAVATNVDPVYMMALADKESSFSPTVGARTSSAEGLFQFIDKTWLDVLKKHGAKHGLAAEAALIEGTGSAIRVRKDADRERIMNLRRDPYLSAVMAAEMLKRDRARLERSITRDLEAGDFYLAHFLGVDSAGRFMKLLDAKPDEAASKVFPAAAKANKSLFYKTEGKKAKAKTVAEVYAKIDQMIDQRYTRYVGVNNMMTASNDEPTP